MIFSTLTHLSRKAQHSNHCYFPLGNIVALLKYKSAMIKRSMCLRMPAPYMARCMAVPLSDAHNLWQRTFLIHKSQKDGYKIHEQSVLQQRVISVTLGQWRHAATEGKALSPMIFSR